MLAGTSRSSATWYPAPSRTITRRGRRGRPACRFRPDAATACRRWRAAGRERPSRGAAEYGAEDVGPFVTAVPWSAGSGSSPRPDAGQRALLSDTRFVLKPDFDGLAARRFGDDGGGLIGEVFFESFLDIGIGFRVLRAHRQPDKAERLQLLADRALVHHHAEPRLDHTLQIDATLVHDVGLLWVRPSTSSASTDRSLALSRRGGPA